jgi:uncharacterized membrane protein HdeD (DUF308 family)
MWRVYGGAIMVIAGIAAFIEAHSHHPIAGRIAPTTEDTRALQALQEHEGITFAPVGHHGLSNTAYDLLRIGAWALVILGALTVLLGLIRYWQRSRSTA